MSRPNRRPRPTRAAVLAFLVLAASTVVPIAHAHLEDLVASAAIEAHHSDRCPTLHVDALCPTCAGTLLTSSVAARVPSERDVEVAPPIAAADLLRPAPDGRTRDPVRAPPIA